MSGLEDAELSERRYQQPHSGRNPIPTIQQYRDAKQKQRQELGYEDSKGASLSDRADGYLHRPHHNTEDVGSEQNNRDESEQADARERVDQQDQSAGNKGDRHNDHPPSSGDGQAGEHDTVQDTSQAVTQGTADPKQKRKNLQKNKVTRAEREVTDPVTHLPVKIHDFTDEDMKEVEEGGRDDDGDGVDDKEEGPQESKESKSRNRELVKAQQTSDREHADLATRFPPPDFDEVRNELVKVQKSAALMVVVVVLVVVTVTFAFELLLPEHILTLQHRLDARFVLAGEALLALALISLCLSVVSAWSNKQVASIWDDAVWHAHQKQSHDALHESPKETTLWLSKLLSSIWPIINPDLFTGLADTLEDVMQASLPRLVRMVSVEDIGQGSESIRILGVRWLPKGAAGKSMTGEGKAKPQTEQQPEGKDKSNAQGSSESSEQDAQDDTKESKDDEAAEGDEQEGMEAEEGDFVNFEIAFAYRASRFQAKMKDKVKNAHLLLAFYLPGNIKLPIWVDLRGVVGWCRVRLQITPDPPFVALSTITFLGQPKIEMKCVPLLKSGLNVMDLPLISKFVQSSLDAALSEYVAPRSITLNLREMLAGSDFKKDTTARGILLVKIRRAFDFKASDVSIPIIGKEKSSDAYVSVGWAKFGKPLWATRVIVADMQPWWEEQAFLLVGAEELDAQESLRVQLWDSDKFSADDDLGRIEMGVKDLMRNENSNEKMWDRVDSFKALEAGKGMPGRLEWSVGYFSKVRLLEAQLQQQNDDPEVKTIEDMKQKVFREAERKLREAAKDEKAELEQLKNQDWINTQVDMVTSSLPPQDYPSGILSIHIHQIVGLQVDNPRQTKSPEEEEESENLEQTNLPDSYCTIILNDQSVFQTRTKPKNSAPFFNACTERFVRDWRNTVVMLAARDQRVHEDDPLLGHVYLNIGDLFREHKTSRIEGFYPLAGGIGYGRMRISCVWRSLQLQLPRNALGWDLGTLEINTEAFSVPGTSKDVTKNRLKFRTNVSKGHMRSAKLEGNESEDQEAITKWSTSKNRPLLLGVRKRYASNVMVEFKSAASGLLPKSSKALAFSTLWLKDIPDEEWTELSLPIYKNQDKLVERAAANVLPHDELSDFKCGDIKIRVKFWRGIGKAHKAVTKKNSDVASVMEVKDAARELGNCPAMVGVKGWREEHGDADSRHGEHEESEGGDDDDSSEDEDSAPSKVNKGGDEVGSDSEEEQEHMSKMGQMAQSVRKRVPGTKAHEKAKQDVKPASDKEDHSAIQSNHREAGKQNISTTQRAPTESHSPDSGQQPDPAADTPGAAAGVEDGPTQAPEQSNGHINKAIQPGATESVSADGQADDKKRNDGSNTAPSVDSEQSSAGRRDSRPSTHRMSSAPGTPAQSRPTTATTNTPLTPQTSASGEVTPSSSNPPRGHHSKRSSGMFNSLKRSFSLKGSPLGKSDSKGKEKRSSRIFSEDNGSSRPTSMAYDRSPLASNPIDSGTASTPSKHPHDAGRPATPSSVAAGSEVKPASRDGSPTETRDDGDANGNADNQTRGQLHRRQRGIMQFKGPRTAKWLQHKAEGAVGKVEDVFAHHEREPGVETEV